MDTRNPRPYAALLIAATVAATMAAAMAGCAPATTPTGGSGAPASPTTSSLSCPTATPGLVLTLTERDNGSTVCLAVGERLEVYLHATPATLWTPISVQGPALEVAVSGKRTLALGVTGGFYAATTVGAARLTASRPSCASPPSASPSPGSPSPGSSAPAGPCLATFAVDVQVR